VRLIFRSRPARGLCFGFAVKDMPLGEFPSQSSSTRGERYPVFVALLHDHCQANMLDRYVSR
jgi:hypothetical protein